MYESPPETFDEVFAPFPPDVRATGGWLREVIRSEFPDLDEDVYGGAKVAMVLYSLGAEDRVALGLQPGSSAVKLYVHDPEHLGDPPFRLEGKGKHMRHVKFGAAPVDEREALVDLTRIPVERRR